MSRVLFFVAAIVMMSAALCGLAAGLGTIFPNFREENPAKIVSSFGGTLCLVISFGYNTFIVALLAMPDLFAITSRRLPFPQWLPTVIVLVVSAGMVVIPMSLALRSVKNLEI